jgi:hypothetical protein
VAQQAVAPASAPTAWWVTTSELNAQTRCAVYTAYDHYTQAFVDRMDPSLPNTLSPLLSGTAESWAHARLDSLRGALGPDFDTSSIWSDYRIFGTPEGGDAVVLASELTLILKGDVSVSDRVDLAYRYAHSDAGWQVGDAHVFDSARHTLDPDAVRSVRAAFSAYLDRLAAVASGDSRDLDSLGEVMAGDELASERQAIDDVWSAGKARRLTPNLRVLVFDVRGDDALVAATGSVHTVDIDLATGEEVADSAGDTTWQQGYRLVRQSGTWRVVHRGAFEQGEDQLRDCGSADQ